MNITKELLYKLLEKSNKDLIVCIHDIKNPYLLHMIAGNYNWNNGFDVPKSIINNINCDLGTALMIFELSDGYTYLFGDKDEFSSKKWEDFICEIKSKIESDWYTNKLIKYTPELSRAEKFQLKKMYCNINPIFIKGTSGETVEILIIST